MQQIGIIPREVTFIVKTTDKLTFGKLLIMLSACVSKAGLKDTEVKSPIVLEE